MKQIQPTHTWGSLLLHISDMKTTTVAMVLTITTESVLFLAWQAWLYIQ